MLLKITNQKSNISVKISPSAKSKTLIRQFLLPDGNNFMVGNERFKAPEVMFQPTKLSKDEAGIHEQTF